jgi:hypothetical protein
MHSLKEDFTCGTLREHNIFEFHKDLGTGMLELIDW